MTSLTFDYTDDVERNRRQVKRFLERFGTTGARFTKLKQEMESAVEALLRTTN